MEQMTITPEALAEAGKVLKTRALTDEKKAYIGAFHRFTKVGNKLILRSTDHRQWVRMALNCEGEGGPDWDLWVDGKKVNQFFTTVDGGKMTVGRNDAGKLSFKRDNFMFTIKPETPPGEVRELEQLIEGATVRGTLKAVLLADVVNWCRPYIYTNSSDPNRQVMTIDGGVAVAGLQEQFVKATGLPSVVLISLNEQNASTMEAWLKALKKDKDEVTVLTTEKNQHIVFREPGTDNYLAMVAEDRKCPLLEGDPDLKVIGDELLTLDRAWLVSRLRMLEIAMEDGMNTVQVKITGKHTVQGSDRASPAEFYIAVDGENQAADTMPIVRRKSDKDYTFRVDLQQLKHAAEKLDTINLNLSYSEEYGVLQIENEEAGESGAPIHKTCVIKTRISREEPAAKKQKKEETKPVADTM